MALTEHKHRDFLKLFSAQKPIMAMLHLKSDAEKNALERTKTELDIYLSEGVDAVIVEDYFGTYDDMVGALEYLQTLKQDVVFGVNCLNFDALGFELARNYHADFIQLDSVIGHVKPRDERSLEVFLDHERASYEGAVLGGVRFKYQPMLSRRTLEQDLASAQDRCDAVAVTQDATGQETSLDKISEFRQHLGDFPLIVAAGVTPKNLTHSLRVADGAVVGSYFKHNYKDAGEVDREHVHTLMQAVNELRQSL